MTDWKQYSDFLTQAAKDDRVGDHDAEVTDVEKGAWPDGDPRWKFRLSLLTANGASADLTMSNIPTPETIKIESGSWDTRKKKAIAGAITLRHQAEEHYGVKDPGEFKRGMMIRVKTIKTRVDAITGKGGFIRVIAFLPKGELTGATASQPF